MLLLFGCGKAKVDVDKLAEQVKPPQVEHVVNLSEGEGSRFSLPTEENARREQLWTVKWKTAQLEYTDEKHFGGTMDQVTGTIYHNGQPVSDFSADHAAADKETGMLQAHDNVRVWSREVIVDKDGKPKRIGKAEMRCDKMEWLASRKLVKASGEVTFETEAYTAGTFKELVMTPEMDSFGTPDQFPATSKKP